MSKINGGLDIVMYFVTHEKVKAYVFLSESKAKKFIKKNQHVWDKYEVEVEDFEIKEALVADEDLLEMYRENLQEYLV